MICKNCGKENFEYEDKCPFCGVEIKDADFKKSTSLEGGATSKKKSSKKFIILLGVAILIIAILLSVIIIQKNEMSAFKNTNGTEQYEIISNKEFKQEETKPEQVTEKTSTTKTTETNEILTTKPTATKKTETTNNESPYNFKNVKVGDYIKFGSYEQDNNTSNGKEEIEWLVLEKQDDRILVISKKVLYGMYFSGTTDYYVTWENSVLRRDLNGEFFDTSFTSTEKSMIPTVTVTADAYPGLEETDQGNNTQDKVFLLSKIEVDKYFKSDSARICKPTAYAEYDRVDTDSYGNCKWYMRTICYDSQLAYVSEEGSTKGNITLISLEGVRPAMWINI